LFMVAKLRHGLAESPPTLRSLGDRQRRRIEQLQQLSHKMDAYMNEG